MSLFPFIFERRFKMTKTQIKKFVKEHKTEIIVGGVALLVGAKLGKKATMHKLSGDILINASNRISNRFAVELSNVINSATCGYIVTPNDSNTTVATAMNDFMETFNEYATAKCKGVAIFV